MFVEVRVDEDLGTIKVSRVVSAIAAGRIVNPKTAGNQIVGGVVWGIGQALHEETLIDHRLGRYMNHNLAEYHIPVNADIPEVEVIFVEEHDEVVNELGSKGVGEIGIVGVAAAVANAIYNATGRRVRTCRLPRINCCSRRRAGWASARRCGKRLLGRHEDNELPDGLVSPCGRVTFLVWPRKVTKRRPPASGFCFANFLPPALLRGLRSAS